MLSNAGGLDEGSLTMNAHAILSKYSVADTETPAMFTTGVG
jgi:hypothetical protein